MNEPLAPVALQRRPRALVRAARALLYLYVLLVACPVRYFPIEPGIDPTWRFALNYAAAHGLVTGVDTVFTTGPLAYLLFPQNIGSNLAKGLLLQAGIWLVIAAILADVFFRGRFRVRNLAAFSLYFGLSAPLFWFNGFGVENLIAAGVLLLIVMFRLHGSNWRYGSALVLVGSLSLFKLTAFMLAFGALAGFILDRFLTLGSKAFRLLAMAAFVPALVAIAVCLGATGSFPALMGYLRGSMEIAGGYSSALSVRGLNVQLSAAFESAAVLAGLLWACRRHNSSAVTFLALFLLLPLFISFKNGFVRQDNHVIVFYCFVELGVALVLLSATIGRQTLWRIIPASLLSLLIWQDQVLAIDPRFVVGTASGIFSARNTGGALRIGRLRENLDTGLNRFQEIERLDPRLVSLVGSSPVAALSLTFSNMAVAGLHVSLYPVIQRYSAYTPYLDGLNAAWVREKGPRFLFFDGQSIDDRDPWAETPAMWLEVYRWYDTRLQGPRDLLLERRMGPRFGSVETISKRKVTFPAELRLPPSPGPVFWTLRCGYSPLGRLEKLLFRVPAVFASVVETGGKSRRVRVIPEVLGSPVAGNFWPGDLQTFAAVFASNTTPDSRVEKIVFDGTGMSAYTGCVAAFLRPLQNGAVPGGDPARDLSGKR